MPPARRRNAPGISPRKTKRARQFQSAPRNPMVTSRKARSEVRHKVTRVFSNRLADGESELDQCRGRPQ